MKKYTKITSSTSLKNAKLIKKEMIKLNSKNLIDCDICKDNIGYHIGYNTIY